MRNIFENFSEAVWRRKTIDFLLAIDFFSLYSQLYRVFPENSLKDLFTDPQISPQMLIRNQNFNTDFVFCSQKAKFYPTFILILF